MKQSPFKFLDAYTEKDKDIFFGRDKEVNDLYEKMSGVKLLLLYGPSGAGKTSLIECGLRNKFSRLDWCAITLRRGDNIIDSFYQTLNNELLDKIPLTEEGKLADENFSFEEAVEQLFLEQFKPIYLLFDQFEELLILGKKEEQKAFFERLNALIKSKLACRIILVMRDEFIGRLSEFEKYLPSLFRDRFRLEQMRETEVNEFLFKTFTAARFKTHFEVQEVQEMTEKILVKLRDERNQIELAHAQVYLDRLFQNAAKTAEMGNLPILRPSLIQEKDNLSDILDAFLEQELKALAKEYSLFSEEFPLEILDTLTSSENTKLQKTPSEMHEKLQKIPEYKNTPFEILENFISHFKQNRIVREIPFGNHNFRYEISHDLLARLIAERRSKRMIQRRKAQAFYEEYTANTVENTDLLSEKEIARLNRYETIVPFPSMLKERVESSITEIESNKEAQINALKAEAEKETNLRKQAEQQRKRARTFAIGAILLAIIAGGVGVFAWTLQNKAEEQTTKIEQLLIGERIASKMIKIPADTFEMGGYGEYDRESIHLVRLDTFWISKYEITQAQWKYVMGTNPSYFKDCDECPVENVSWNDVKSFIKKLNENTHLKYRLPTEAEWEYSAKGGQNFVYSGSDSIDDVAWYHGDSDGKTQPVGKKKANGFGLYDMSGNVSEWCQDVYSRDYYEKCKEKGVVINPVYEGSNSYRVYRGGSWNRAEYLCYYVYRSRNIPAYRRDNLGFRLARTE